MKVRLLFVIGLLLGILGCAESPERHLNRVHKHKLKNSTPAYAEGYKDGCASGSYLAGDKRYAFKKNALRTQQDALYSRGWREGQQICHQETKERLSSQERLHNRIYHFGRTQHHSEFREAGNIGYGGNLQTEEEQAIWETLKK